MRKESGVACARIFTDRLSMVIVCAAGTPAAMQDNVDKLKRRVAKHRAPTIVPSVG